MTTKLILCDQDPGILEAWRAQFEKHPQVAVVEGDPLEGGAEAFLLPGNSFGFLDGGLELRVAEAFGMETQDLLRERIRRELHGELLVGQAIVVRRPQLPWALVYAPIWRTPCALGETVNVFLAARAALLAVGKEEPSPASLLIPGMGVSPPGEMHPAVSARQLRYAWEISAGLRGPGDKNLSQAARRGRKLQSVPLTGRAEEE